MRASAGRDRLPGWCSLRFRFDEDELSLLRAAEHLRGAELARAGRADTLRDALTLARVSRKATEAGPSALVSLSESELQLLASAVRYAAEEVRWLGEKAERDLAATSSPLARQRLEHRREALGQAFPNFGERGSWRGFGLHRALEALATHMDEALAAG